MTKVNVLMRRENHYISELILVIDLRSINLFYKKQQKDIPICPHPIVEINTESIAVSINSMAFVHIDYSRQFFM